MHNRNYALLIAIVAAAGGAANGAARANPGEHTAGLRAQVMKWQQSDAGSHDIGRRLVAEYRALGLHDQVIATRVDASDDALASLFDLVALVSMHSKDPDAALQLSRLAHLLFLRDRLTSGQAATVRGAAIAQRHFDQARRWERLLSPGSFDPLPAKIRALSSTVPRSVWRVHPMEDRIDQDEIKLPTGTHVVMVSHPLCGFSRNAITAIANDARLTALTAGRVVTITPQDRNLDDAAIRRWNREQPAWPHVIVNAESEWSLLDRWYTPTFYVFNGEMLVDVVEGWPKDGSSRDRLLAALLKANSVAAAQAE